MSLTETLGEFRRTIHFEHDGGDMEAFGMTFGALVDLWRDEEIPPSESGAADILQRETLKEALDRVLIGGNHLASVIGGNHPPYTASCDEAMEHYGAGDRYEVWCCWRAIMQARDAVDDIPGIGVPRSCGDDSRAVWARAEAATREAEARVRFEAEVLAGKKRDERDARTIGADGNWPSTDLPPGEEPRIVGLVDETVRIRFDPDDGCWEATTGPEDDRRYWRGVTAAEALAGIAPFVQCLGPPTPEQVREQEEAAARSRAIRNAVRKHAEAKRSGVDPCATDGFDTCPSAINGTADADPVHWNPFTKVVQDHCDGTIYFERTNAERARRGLTVPWTREIGSVEVNHKPVF